MTRFRLQLAPQPYFVRRVSCICVEFAMQLEEPCHLCGGLGENRQMTSVTAADFRDAMRPELRRRIESWD